MAEVPSGVIGYFRSAYPLLTFDDDWLEGCWQALRERYPDKPWTDLKKKVESQLLLSDLAVSTKATAKILPAAGNARDDGSSVLFPKERVGVLVQIMEITEIGYPALQLLDMQKAKIEDKKYLQREGRENRRVLMDVDPTQANHNGQDAQREEPSNDKAFPRSMLRLVVSDGHSEYIAIEYKRVASLSLDDTPLGAKMFLRNIRLQRGVLFLEPGSCTLKPDSLIHALNNQRDELLLLAFEKRIQPDYNPPIQARPQNGPPRQAQGHMQPKLEAPPRAPPARTAKVGPSTFPAKSKVKKEVPKAEELDDDLFDELDLDDEEMDEIVPSQPVVAQASRKEKKGKSAKKEERLDDDDEDLWAEAELKTRAAPPTKKPKVENPPTQVIEIGTSEGDLAAYFDDEVDILDDEEEDEEAEVQKQLVRSSSPWRSAKPCRPEVIEIDDD